MGENDDEVTRTVRALGSPEDVFKALARGLAKVEESDLADYTDALDHLTEAMVAPTPGVSPTACVLEVMEHWPRRSDGDPFNEFDCILATLHFGVEDSSGKPMPERARFMATLGRRGCLGCGALLGDDAAPGCEACAPLRGLLRTPPPTHGGWCGFGR